MEESLFFILYQITFLYFFTSLILFGIMEPPISYLQTLCRGIASVWKNIFLASWLDIVISPLLSFRSRICLTWSISTIGQGRCKKKKTHKHTHKKRWNFLVEGQIPHSEWSETSRNAKKIRGFGLLQGPDLCESVFNFSRGKIFFRICLKCAKTSRKIVKRKKNKFSTF